MLHAPDLRTALRATLEDDPRPEPAAGDRLASVLALIVETPTPSLLFTVRASGLSRHAGEISFPGGLRDPGESPAQTALREAHEEIGLDPAAPEILGALPAVHTHVSAILVVPFVGVLSADPLLSVNAAEITDVLMFPVARLAAVETATSYAREGGRTWHGWAYELEGHTVWGVTGWILHELLERMRREAPWMTQ
jgi:8-oxo-dGTP pyrophosphatase MutT (NUDIX family)